MRAGIYMAMADLFMGLSALVFVLLGIMLPLVNPQSLVAMEQTDAPESSSGLFSMKGVLVELVPGDSGTRFVYSAPGGSSTALSSAREVAERLSAQRPSLVRLRSDRRVQAGDEHDVRNAALDIGAQVVYQQARR